MRSRFSALRVPVRSSRLARLTIFLVAIGSLLAIPVVVDALTSPRTWVDAPAEAETVTGDVTVVGSARHNKGVSVVQLVVKNLDQNTYWNGTSWQRRFVRFDVEVDKPGATQTGWSYTMDADDMSRGNFRARAFARSVEGNGDAYGGDLNDFRYVPDLDPELYDTEVTAPAEGAEVAGPIRIEGLARSIDGVAAVNVVVRNTDTNLYWSAKSNSWTAEFERVKATLDAPNGKDVSWHVDIPAENSIAGPYFTRAWVVTSSGKGDPFGRGQANFTVSGAVPPPASTTTAPPTTVQPTVPTAPTVPTVPTVPTTTPPSGGNVIWEDNFDSLDTSRWALEHSTYGDGNNELQCYRPENVSVSNGRLVLRAVTETYTCPNGSTRLVTSGMVRSRGVSFEPGQAIEFRVKLNPADENSQGGLWPAVWSSGWAGGGWPNAGEMDYLEVMTANNPRRSVYSIHYAKPDGSHGVTNKQVIGSENFSASWHTVRFDYGRDGQLAWYLDGTLVNRVTDANTAQGYPAPFDQATNEIKINLALGGRPGPLDPKAVGTEGATFEVDYIKVLTLDGGPVNPEPPTTTQPTTTQPTTTQPSTTRPTTTQPSTSQPTTTRPSSNCPNGDPSILLPCQGVLIGASGDFTNDDGGQIPKQDHFAAMEARMGADFDIFHDFLQWRDLVDKTWPSSKTQALADDGHILLTNWKSPNGSVGDWARIANGDFDADIAKAAGQMADFGEPTFITFFHEPEDNIRDAAGGDDAKIQRYIDDYRAAFRHIHAVFDANGADNAIWVWDMQGWLGGFESYYESGLYPGDDVVDWVAWNPYNWQGCDNHGNSNKWKTFTEVVAPFYDWLDEGGPNRPSRDKPLMLGEWGSEENDNAVNSDQTKAEWLNEARQELTSRFPRLRAVVYFDTEGRRSNGSVQFCEWAIDSSQASVDAMRGLLLDTSLNPRW